MTKAQRQSICLESTPYYHCSSRCVRRAFLSGRDPFSNKSYEHRRGWVEGLLLKLTQAFAIDVVGYAVMSNHYHAVLKVRIDQGSSLSDEDLIDRWSLIYNPTPLMQRYRSGDELTIEELDEVKGTLNHYRESLMSISRFMGYLNERIAREANREDDCRGRFWEGRSLSKALLTEDALLQSLTHIDLNPIRAGIATAPDNSEFASVKRRIDNVDDKDL